MANGQTIILAGPSQRALATRLILQAPDRAIVNIQAERRSNDQNSLMWALLSDISRAKPEGRTHTPEVWKNLFLHACGHAVQFEMGLNGQPFPVGFRSSRLTKAQMSELLECLYEYGGRHGIRWTDERDAA